MKPTQKHATSLLTRRPQSEHAERLGISSRQLRRRLVEFGPKLGIVPVDVVNNAAIYTDAQIAQLEAARVEAKAAPANGHKVLTVAQAKRKAGVRK